MLSAIKICKTYVKSLFRFCGLEISLAPKFELYEWLKEKDINTIFDVGANTGQFASQFHKLFPDAEIYSFEPITDCYIELLKSMKHFSKFHAFNFALGDENTKTEMYHNDYSPSSSLLPMEESLKEMFPYTEKAKISEVNIRRLDDVADDLCIKDNILIKMDVQGFEDKVILGGDKLISRASVLILETCFQPLYIGQVLFDTIYDMLKQRGFVYMGSEDIRRNPMNGQIIYCDSIFCKK